MAFNFSSFLDRIVGRRSVEVPRTNAFYYGVGGSRKILPKNYLDWYKENPFVFAAIEERAKAISNAKFYIKTKEGELIQNALTTKLNNPNQYQSGQEFIRQDITFQSIYGTSYWYINRLLASEGFDSIDILNLPANQLDFPNIDQKDYLMSLLTKSEFEQEIYYLKQTNEQIKKKLEKELLLPFFDTTIFTNPYFSQSRLESLQFVVSNSQAALESQNTFLSSPGGIGMIVSREKTSALGSVPLLEEDRKEIEKSLQEDYGSLAGQRNVQIVGRDVDYISTLPKIGDLKLNETAIQMGLIIFGQFGLPKELFTALQEGSTFENQKEAYKRFLDSEGLSLITSRCNSINKSFPQKEGELVANFNHLSVMQEDKASKNDSIKLKVDTLGIAFEKGVIDINEYRALLTEDLGLGERKEVKVDNSDDIKQLLFEASLSLRGTVGGVQGILAINQSVAAGTISRENAINLLVEVYQYDRSVAETLITTSSQVISQ